MAISQSELLERPQLTRVSWGSVFSGLASSFGIWLMLLLLGAAIGFSSLNPTQGSSWLDLVKGLGIWGGIAAIIAVFIGGWIAAYLSTTLNKLVGALHGVTVWGLALAVAVWGTSMFVSRLVGTATTVVGSAAGAAANVVGGAAKGATQVFDANALTNQANNYLKSQGMPPVTQAQMQGALNSLEQQAMAGLREGRSLNDVLNQQSIAQALSSKTNLSRSQADAVAGQLSQQIQSAGSQLQQTAQSVGHAAQGAVQGAGTAVKKVSAGSSWGLWILSALTFIGAIVGGALGALERSNVAVGSERRVHRELPLRPREA